MSFLAPSQRPELWNITEKELWRKNDAKCQEQYAEASRRWQQQKQDLIAHIRKLESEALELRQKEDQLIQDLMAVRREVALVDETHNDETLRLRAMDRTPEERLLQPPKLPLLAKLDLRGPQAKHKDAIVASIDADELISAEVNSKSTQKPSSLKPLRISSLISTSPECARGSLAPPENVTLAEMEVMAAAAKKALAKAHDAITNDPLHTSTPGYKLTSLPTFSSVTTAVPSSSDEILKKDLVLRHNGAVYTAPECMEGVPLEKIGPGHSYWDPKWPDLRAMVETRLRSYEEKYQAVKKAISRGEAVGNIKYYYGREINRGQTILKFLDRGVISPYQLLSKRFMGAGKSSITSYDTLFRLCETVEALAKYKTDVEPVDWLRQRLHELIEVHGADFNFSKTIHDFYNDPKLTALRLKSGFKNIGRRSGVKMPRRKDGSADKPAPRPQKRKTRHSCGTPSPPDESAGEPSVAEDEDTSSKRPRAAAKVLDELDTGEISDTDSFSGAPIAAYDFRIYQIKTRRFTSSQRVTQYWLWVPEHNMFEHRVLEDIKPVVWGVHREPIDFTLRLEDVVKISWNAKALRIYLVMSDRQICFEDDKPRGDVMVAFKRENTMRRFIQFCRWEEIELVQETWEKMEYLWASMEPEQLLAGGEEPNDLPSQ